MIIYGLAKKLRLLREQHGLTQSEVARRINVSSSAVSSYEAETSTPSLKTLIRLANLYCASTDYLLGINHPMDKAILDTTDLNQQQLVSLQKLIDTMRY